MTTDTINQVKNYCLSIRELQKSFEGADAPAAAQATSALTSLAANGYSILSNVKSIVDRKGTTIAKDFQVLVNKVNGLHNGVAENLFHKSEFIATLNHVTENNALACYTEAKRIENWEAEERVSESAALAAVAGKFKDFKAMGEALAAGGSKDAIEGESHTHDEDEAAYNDHAQTTITTLQRKTIQQLENAGTKLIAPLKFAKGDRIAVNYGAKLSPGEWWLASIDSLSAGKANILYDTGDKEVFPERRLHSATVLKLKSDASNSANSWSYNKVMAVSESGSGSNKGKSNVVVVEHVALVPGLSSSETYDSKVLERNDAIQVTYNDAKEVFKKGASSIVQVPVMAYLVLSEQKLMMFHADSIKNHADELDSANIDPAALKKLKEQEKALKESRKELQVSIDEKQALAKASETKVQVEKDKLTAASPEVLKELGASINAEASLNAEVNRLTKEVEELALKSDTVLTEIEKLQKEGKDTAEALKKIDTQEKKRKTLLREIKEKTAAIKEHQVKLNATLKERKAAKGATTLLKLMDVERRVHEDLADLNEKMAANLETAERLNEDAKNIRANAQTKTGTQSAGHSLASQVLAQLNEKAGEEYVLMSPVGIRSQRHTSIMCYWIATAAEQRALNNNFYFARTQAGVNEWSFINQGK